MERDSIPKSNSDYTESKVPDIDVTSLSQVCNLLEQAEINNYGLLPRGSNYVFLVKMTKDEIEFSAIYKPRQGETPLWDFPDGTLYKRELAAFMVSQALRWHLIPPTVIRDGPFGIGSIQWFVDTTKSRKQYSRVIGDMSKLKQVALFDHLVNNADRKAGHFLVDNNGRLWVVDHGLTFNTVPKLRTVLWDFAGQTIPEKLLADVKVLQDELRQTENLHDDLRHLLEKDEMEALQFRINRIIEKPVFTFPTSHWSIPWPMI